MQGKKDYIPKMMYQVHLDELVPQNNFFYPFFRFFCCRFASFSPIAAIYSLAIGNPETKNNCPYRIARGRSGLGMGLKPLKNYWGCATATLVARWSF